MQRSFWLLALLFAVAVTAAAEESKRPPGLTLESIQVEPGAPGADTLCKLSATVKNAGAKTASALAFRVKVDGKELAVYRNELFFQPVAAGAETRVKLQNFWSSETGRPFPASGNLTVEVTLTEARWMDRKTDNGAEVWTPAGPVEGLPLSKSLTLNATKPTVP